MANTIDPGHFRVLIAGGGPVGLTAAHTLHQAGIDFVLLERRESAIVQAGSNLVLFPNGLRALGQLGLYDAFVAAGSPLTHTTRQNHDGQDMGTNHFFPLFNEHFGLDPYVLSRHDITRALYEALPPEAQAKILPGKKITQVSSDDAGATLTCEDGTSYGGSIILGADGAHSTVRKHMETQAGVDQTPFLTTYRCLWIRFPTATCPELRPGATSETHGPGISSQLFSGRETTVAGLYIRLDRPTRARTRYSRLDEQSVVEQWADLPLLPSRALTVLEAYNKRIESGLVSLEEGVAHHWHWDGRIVLAGDALHKYTPSTGAGCNQGIMDVVSLSNHLRAAVDEAASQGVSEPSATRIQDAFEAYRSERWLMAHAHRNMSGLMTGLSTWSNWFFGLLDRWPMRFEMVQRTALFSMATLDARMPVLDYVECEERFAGSTPWARRLPAVH